VKQEYNSNISLNVETVLLVPINKTIFIRHCSKCDTLDEGNAFLEWLTILRAGTKATILNEVSYLDLKHVSLELQCTTCNYNSVTQVIFEWVSINDSENKA